MTSMMNFIKIYQLVQTLVGDIQTDRRHEDLISLTSHFKGKYAKKDGKMKINK
jgi:hypothetical protein